MKAVFASFAMAPRIALRGATAPHVALRGATAPHIVLFALIGMTVAIPSVARAQVQSADQQACINVLNKGMLKLASTQGKLASKCIASYAKEVITTGPLDCYDGNSLIGEILTDVCGDATAACVETPSYGPMSCTGLGGATDASKALAADLYDIGPGQDIELCSASKDACICQAKTTKATYKLYDQVLKSFNACKKLGLRDDTPIATSTDLGACLGEDSKLKIENAGIKLGVAVDVSCTGIAQPYQVGECAGLTGTTLQACLIARARCRACLAVTSSDNLSNDCDLFDDSTANTSCP